MSNNPTYDLDALMATEQLPAGFRHIIESVCKPLVERITAHWRVSQSCLTVGLCGMQGSGKSTIARVLHLLLEAEGLTVATLSIDDFYLTQAERQRLASTVHPLLQTRGVPGTHDVGLAFDVLRALRAGTSTTLPRFDKARDDRFASSHWPVCAGPVHVILFEGWCVGARPQIAPELRSPINALERDEDATGAWRQYVNDALAGDYQQLFATIDWLIMLAAPDFSAVYAWRTEQEDKLRQRLVREHGDVSKLMSDQAVRRFVSHYERLTRHMLNEMPVRANALVRLNHARQVLDLGFRE